MKNSVIYNFHVKQSKIFASLLASLLLFMARN